MRTYSRRPSGPDPRSDSPPNPASPGRREARVGRHSLSPAPPGTRLARRIFRRLAPAARGPRGGGSRHIGDARRQAADPRGSSPRRSRDHKRRWPVRTLPDSRPTARRNPRPLRGRPPSLRARDRPDRETGPGRRLAEPAPPCEPSRHCRRHVGPAHLKSPSIRHSPPCEPRLRPVPIRNARDARFARPLP